MPATLKSQGQWLDIVKTDGCYSCHQLGNKATRTIPKALGQFENSTEAWEARIQSGQASENMVSNIGRLDTQRALKLFADWTDRIAAGELPAEQPSRPQGVERNVVVTHVGLGRRQDLSARRDRHRQARPDRQRQWPDLRRDRRRARRTCRCSTRSRTRRRRSTSRCATRTRRVSDRHAGCRARRRTGATSGSGTARPACTTRCSTRRGASGSPRASAAETIRLSAGRARTIRRPSCSRSRRATRQLAMYDPKTQKVHADRHLLHDASPAIRVRCQQHAVDQRRRRRRTRWSAGSTRRSFWRPATPPQSQGWTALVLDTNGNGKRDDYVEPNQPVDPGEGQAHRRRPLRHLGHPTDGTIWGTLVRLSRRVVHLIPGANPPATALAEYYEVPSTSRRRRCTAIRRAAWISTRKGVVWMPLASGHLASFDRRKCEGSAERAECDRQALPGRLDPVPVPRPAIRRAMTGLGQRRSQLSHLGRSVRHVRARQGRADRHRQRQ